MHMIEISSRCWYWTAWTRYSQTGSGIRSTVCLKKLHEDIQTVLLSSSLPVGVEKLRTKFIQDLVRISVTEDRSVVAAGMEEDKLGLLRELLRKAVYEKAGVLCNSRRTVDWLAEMLQSSGIEALAIHGEMCRDMRATTLMVFNRGFKVLVSTNALAHLNYAPKVSLVINYDLPSSTSTLTVSVLETNRIARTW
ncbi:translation initiation factor eIF4A [Gamsiella multidivaricata]|nr:translation initiation factor eIF4A [Gamsiella multidivaricata]